MACTFYEPLYFRCKIFLLRCIEKINLASGRLTFRRRKIKEVVLERKKLLGKIKTNLQLPMLWFNCVFCKTMDNFLFWHSAHSHTHFQRFPFIKIHCAKIQTNGQVNSISTLRLAAFPCYPTKVEKSQSFKKFGIGGKLKKRS